MLFETLQMWDSASFLCTAVRAVNTSYGCLQVHLIQLQVFSEDDGTLGD